VFAHAKKGKLKLFHYRLTWDLTSSLADAIPFMQGIKYLDLTENGISDASGAALLKSLGKYEALKGFKYS
jgi:hypothetical protein